MGLIIAKTDFVDPYGLSKSIEDTITAYISEYEEKYLRELLGASLFTTFKANKAAGSGTPTAPFLIIYNELNEDLNGCLLHSDGMKKMLLGFIYWEYIKGTHSKHTGTGLVTDVSEISINANFNHAYNLYNKSIYTYKAIQRYIVNNIRDYDGYNGQNKRLASPI